VFFHKWCADDCLDRLITINFLIYLDNEKRKDLIKKKTKQNKKGLLNSPQPKSQSWWSGFCRSRWIPRPEGAHSSHIVLVLLF
jgi:hypothetical protein